MEWILELGGWAWAFPALQGSYSCFTPALLLRSKDEPTLRNADTSTLIWSYRGVLPTFMPSFSPNRRGGGVEVFSHLDLEPIQALKMWIPISTGSSSLWGHRSHYKQVLLLLPHTCLFRCQEKEDLSPEHQAGSCPTGGLSHGLWMPGMQTWLQHRHGTDLAGEGFSVGEFTQPQTKF